VNPAGAGVIAPGTSGVQRSHPDRIQLAPGPLRRQIRGTVQAARSIEIPIDRPAAEEEATHGATERREERDPTRIDPRNHTHGARSQPGEIHAQQNAL
jgi:hypothetical protein